ncbi:MAG: transcription repressor NadR [Lachnospiraceae bacterium]|nr:transcription repressor NadR [Lachnospiraceae bacterium]
MGAALDGAKRRKAIIEYLESRTQPTNGTELAKHFGVSRQIIVQDIALLRAENREILSTNKGYVVHHPLAKNAGCTAVIMVRHTAEQTFEEMQTIVDYGGSMLDVSIDHDLYGHIRVDLVIHDLQDAEEFCQKMRESTSRPLKELTEGCHYHTIKAPSQKALDLIRKELKEKGMLLE